MQGSLKRWALIVEYDGKNYSGSQLQRNTKNKKIKTIQNELETAICTLINKQIKTIFSGRTDAGVHSLGQVVHLDLEDVINPEKLVNSLNAILPVDIAVKSMYEVEKDFHAQKSARWRWYRYIITNRMHRSVWDRNSLLVRHKLDLERMNEALGYLKGSHDFTSFRTSNPQSPSSDCEIGYAKCSARGSQVYIDIAAGRFLYNMVRIIVGTLLMIEKKSLEPELMKDILNQKDRTKAGKTISPEGLYLMKVFYENNINMEAIINENVFC